MKMQIFQQERYLSLKAIHLTASRGAFRDWAVEDLNMSQWKMQLSS